MAMALEHLFGLHHFNKVRVEKMVAPKGLIRHQFTAASSAFQELLFITLVNRNPNWYGSSNMIPIGAIVER